MADPLTTVASSDEHSISRRVEAVVRSFLRALLLLLPGGAAMYIYTRLLRLALLRRGANRGLRKLIPEELKLPEGVLFLNRNDPVVSGALALGVYEAFFAAQFREQSREGMIVVDIGANLGYYTLIASMRAARVIAFEPEHENMLLIAKTVARNLRDNVTLIEKGLGDIDETRTLSLHPDNKGKHTLLPIEEAGVERATISVTTLDAALLALGSPHVDLLKIDIEGWEAKALRGAKATIARSHPTIMFEYGPERIRAAGDDPLTMLEALVDEGYSLFVIDEDRARLLPICLGTFDTLLRKNEVFVNILAEPSRIPS